MWYVWRKFRNRTKTKKTCKKRAQRRGGQIRKNPLGKKTVKKTHDLIEFQ